MARNFKSGDFSGSTNFSDFYQQTDDSLDALQSKFSGTGTPSTTVGHMEYVDTTDGVLYRRNSGDTNSYIIDTVSEDRVISKTSDYTAVVGDFGKTILVDSTSGDVTITLPPAATAGDYWWVTIKRVDSSNNLVSIDGNGSETIDDSLTKVLYSNNTSVCVMCDASNFSIINYFKGNEVKVELEKNVAQTITNNTETAVTWQTELSDTNSMHSTVSNTERVTVPFDGVYEVDVTIAWEANSTGQRLVSILKNGTTTVHVNRKPAEQESNESFHRKLTLSANDYIQVNCYQSSGGDLDVSPTSSLTRFEVRLIQ